MFQHLARRSTSKRDSSQCPLIDIRRHVLAFQQHSHLAIYGEGQYLGTVKSKWARLGTLRPSRKQLDGVAFPCRAVHDRLSIRSKARLADCSAAESELLIGRR